MNGDSLFIFFNEFLIYCVVIYIFFCEEIKKNQQAIFVSHSSANLDGLKNSLKRKKENGIVDFLFFFVKNKNDCKLFFALMCSSRMDC
jgi:hypothetical protein